MELARFASLRPFLYHLTARANLSTILEAGVINSASDLIHRSGCLDLLTQKRPKHVTVNVEGRTVGLRDQAPLHRGNIRLEGGLDFAGLIRHLNDRVYFWPGSATSPVPPGLRHFARYAHEDCVVFVVPTLRALEVAPAEFCRYNSGSPRCSAGNPSPRGPRTFQPASAFDGQASEVVEVTFPGRFPLPRADVRIAEVRDWT